MGLVKKHSSKRRYLRYKSAHNLLCGLYFGDDLEMYSPEIVGIVCNESYKGCSFATVASEKIKKGLHICIQVGELSPVVGVIRWVNEVDEDLFKVGVEYLIDHIK